MRIQPAVDKRVDRRVEPAQPRDEHVHGGIDRLVLGYEGRDDVKREERQPADDEDGDDDRESLRRFVFAFAVNFFGISAVN